MLVAYATKSAFLNVMLNVDAFQITFSEVDLIIYLHVQAHLSIK